MSSTPVESDTTSNDITKFIASGSVSGAIVAVIFVMYKLCKGRKLHSKCCGSELDISSDTIVPTIVIAHEPSPKPSPTIKRKSIEIVAIEDFKLSQ